MKISYVINFFAIFVVMVIASGQAVALSVYDVIQLSTKNYSDEDITSLIKATDSAFVLEAEDLPQLMKLGVSEAVIRVMLKAQHKSLPVNTSQESKQAQSSTATPDSHSHHRATTEAPP